MQTQNSLKKGKKIKVGNEEFTVDDFKNEENFNDELGEGIRNREIVLSNGDKDNPKIVKQKIFVKKGKNSMYVGAYKEISQANRFKNGFSFQNQKVFVSKSVFGGKKKD